MVGHATHFLERTGRLEYSQEDTAMELYKNPERLRIILTELNPPKSFQRVAIALKPGDQGPYLVATRKGEFVTCLAEGMHPTDLYVISRERFDSYYTRLNDLFKRGEYWPEVSKDMSDNETLDTLPLTRGFELSREEFMAASALQPSLKYMYTKQIYDYTELLRDIQQIRMNQKSLPEEDNSFYRSYWNAYFSLGHMSAMASMFGPRGLESFVDWNRSALYPFYPPFHTGQISNAARALFAAGRMGKHALQVCEAGLRMYHSAPMWMFSVMAAAVIGLRHKKLRAKARRIIQITPAIITVSGDYLKNNWQIGLGAAKRLLDAPDEMRAASLKFARTIYRSHSEKRNYPDQWQFSTDEDVPEDLAMCHMVNLFADFRTEPAHLIFLTSALDWLSRTDAEQLYLPKEFFTHMNYRWSPQFTKKLFSDDRAWYGKRSGERNLVPLPKRNDPCFCGSGQKFKKCCMHNFPAKITSQNFNREAPLDHLYRVNFPKP